MGTREAIVVLDDHDGSFEARVFQGFDPLIGIQMLWIEIIRIFFISPTHDRSRYSSQSG